MIQIPQFTLPEEPFLSLARDKRSLSPRYYQQNILTRIWQAIVRCVKNIYNIFSSPKESITCNLSKRQVRLIRQAQADRTPLKEISFSIIKPQQPFQIFERIDIPCGSEHDPSLEGLKEFLQAFTQIAVNTCTFQDVLVPIFPKWKNGLSKFIEAIPEWNVTLLNLKESLSPLMSGLKKADDASITLVIQQMLRLYAQQDREIVKVELLKRLQELKVNGNLDEAMHKRSIKYIEPFLAWLYHPNNWMITSSQPVNLHHFISDSFRFLNALTSQIEQGLMDDFFKKLQTFINQDFEEQIQLTLELSTKRITSILANRLADLIEHLPYTEMYNQILSHTLNQMEERTVCDQVTKEQSQLISDAHKVENSKPSNVTEIERLKTAEELLRLVKKDGGKEKYLEKEFLRAFSRLKACHPKIKDALNAPSEKEQTEIQNQIYKDLIDNLFPFFLPVKKCVLPHGLETQVKGISKIFEETVYPEKIQVLKDSVIEEFEKILAKSKVKDKENFKEYFFALTYIFFIENQQKRVKDFLATRIQKLFTRLSSKQYLDFLATEYIFPFLINKTLEGFVRAYMNRQQLKIAEIFHKAQESDAEVEIDDHVFLNNLYDSIKEQLIDFNMEEAGIDRARFNAIVKPVIAEIRAFIADKKSENPSEPLSLLEIRKYLDLHFKYEAVPVNSDYGKLIMHALFKMGSFGGWLSEKIIGWFQGTLSETTSQSLHVISASYQHLINSIVWTSSQYLLSIDAVRANVFSGELSEEQLDRQTEKVKTNFPLQIRRISALTHDSIYRTLESRSEPWIQHLTPTTTKINEVIKNVVGIFFEKPKLNVSLLLSYTEIIKRALKEAVDKMTASLRPPVNRKS